MTFHPDATRSENGDLSNMMFESCTIYSIMRRPEDEI